MARRWSGAGAAGGPPPQAQKHVNGSRAVGQAVPPAFLVLGDFRRGPLRLAPLALQVSQRPAQRAFRIIPQPIFVAGRVVMEDGAAPPGLVTLETVCNGAPHGEGYTDSKGYFSIELGARNGVIQDASEFSPTRAWKTSGVTGGSATSGSPDGSQSHERKYMGCDLQAKLAGYRSQTVSLSGRRPMDDPNVGTLLLHRNGPAEEGNTISAL